MSKSQESLYSAIVTKLRLDTGADSLVALTTHSATDIRIARDSPRKKGETPFLGVSIFATSPLINNAMTSMRESTVIFKAYAGKELTAIRIADRMEDLIHNVSTPTDPYSFSNSNISTREVRFLSRAAPDFDEDVEVWSISVVVSIIWIDNPCPDPED